MVDQITAMYEISIHALRKESDRTPTRNRWRCW